MNHHVFIISLPAQGHLNPSAELARNFALAGARVTFATIASLFHKLKSLPSLDGVSLTSFSDGHDDDTNACNKPGYFIDLKTEGSKSLAGILQTLSDAGHPVTMLVYALFLPWAATVARQLNVPSALFVIQCATAFSIYNRCCNSRDGVFVVNDHIDTSISIKLPVLPLFKWGDIPTYILPTSQFFSEMTAACQLHMEVLEEDPNQRILVNTLDGLEPDAMETIPNAIVVGPLIPTTFSDDHGSYLQWLDSKPEKSVIYASFGSLAVLNKVQKQEILHGLIEFGRPFLLVLRDKGDNEEEDEEIKDLKTKMGDDGLILGWCSQMEVLRHGAIGCFVTHCGWNSTLESMVAGVAIVGCPQTADQPTNAKMVEEVWGNGVRAVVDDTMVVKREEIKRCLEMVMGGGERTEVIKQNVEKWKKMAQESMDNGSSQINLKVLLDTI